MYKKLIFAILMTLATAIPSHAAENPEQGRIRRAYESAKEKGSQALSWANRHKTALTAAGMGRLAFKTRQHYKTAMGASSIAAKYFTMGPEYETAANLILRHSGTELIKAMKYGVAIPVLGLSSAAISWYNCSRKVKNVKILVNNLMDIANPTSIPAANINNQDITIEPLTNQQHRQIIEELYKFQDLLK